MILDRIDRVAKAIIESMGEVSLSDEDYLFVCSDPEEEAFIESCRRVASLLIAEVDPPPRVLQ